MRTLVGAAATIAVSARVAHGLTPTTELDATEGMSALPEPPRWAGGENSASTPLYAWRFSPPRWFFGLRIDAGFAFGNVRGSVGYGRPHDHWAGLDVMPFVNTGGGGVYGGLRYELRPWIDLRSGARFVQSFEHSFLEQLDRYERRDIDNRTDERARYVTWDSELELRQPLGPGRLYVEGQSVYLPDIDDDQWAYLETMRVVAAPNFVGRARLAYEFIIESVEGLIIAPVGEAVWIPERDGAVVWRGGALFRWWLYPDTELRIDVLPVVVSPDALGNWGGTPFQAGLRWFWATE